MKGKKIAIMLLMLGMGLGACKGKKDIAESGGEAESATDEDAFQDGQEGGESGARQEPAGCQGKCPADVAKFEAGRAAAEAGLVKTAADLKLHSLLVDFIGEAEAFAANREFEKIKSLGKKYYASLKGLKAGVSDDEVMLMANVLEKRMMAYSVCMSVTTKDAGWCDLLGRTWDGTSEYCSSVHEIYALMIDGAVRQGRSCEEVMKQGQRWSGDSGVAFCEAVIKADPKLCPWEGSEIPGAYCRAAAGRGRLSACEDEGLGWEEDGKDVQCCRSFAWRFAGLFTGSSKPDTVPEAGALEGKSEGCMNALKWGLLESLAEMFEVGLAEPSLSKEEQFGEFICPALIYWSKRPMPLP
ncbi:MAG: hypothetical protein ABIJ56_18950 [Pseudomonadota bacterium]